MLKTLKSKFIFFTTVFILITIGFPTLFLLMQLRENFKQRSSMMLATTLEVVDSGLYQVMLLGEKKNVQQLVDNIALNQGIEHIRFFDHQGKILYSSRLEEIGKNLKVLTPYHDLSAIDTSGRLSLYDQENIYSFIQPVINRSECRVCHGDANIISYLDIDIDLTDAEKTFNTASDYILFLAILIIFILVLGFYYLFNFFITKPLNRIITALNEVKKGNLAVRLSAVKKDEMGIVEQHFNTMVNRIQNDQHHIEEMHFEELRRADKLVTLGELAAEMAHEINNPAGIILSRSDYLQMIPELKKHHNDLEVITKQVDKISRITKNILKYSKKPIKHFQQVDLISILNGCFSFLEPRIIKKKINIIKKIEVMNPHITGDALQIEQTFINLINNAIDALAPEGNIIITIRRDENYNLQVKIEDNGTGMDDHTKEQIFSPFFTTKSDDKGTGLGLYIVKNICKDHQAEINCASTLGEGSTFTITFRQE
jgi:signal transduction histidine kinase